jgi:hypothetical protein
MKGRLSEIFFVLICLVLLALGAILLIKADETPAPGLFLIAGSVVALIWHYMGSTHRTAASLSSDDASLLSDEDEKGPIERDREIYEQQAERRRRDESDI